MSRHPPPTPEQIDLACEALAKGHSFRRAAAYVGIDTDVWNNWVSMAQCSDAAQSYIDFANRTVKAERDGITKLGDEWQKCWGIYTSIVEDPKADTRVRMEAAAFVLKHRHGVYAARAPAEVKVSGDKAAPLVVESISPAFKSILERSSPEQLLALVTALQPPTKDIH